MAAGPRSLHVTQLGPRTLDSPLRNAEFIDDASRVLLANEIGPGEPVDPGVSFELAGPREKIFFQPEETTVALVTCGGLSPGLNNVIRSVYRELQFNYGVDTVLGIREGYRGLNPAEGLEPMLLDARMVSEIHNAGGTLLGSSRGAQDPKVMVDYLESLGVDVLVCIGGDGTLRGAHDIHAEISRRGLPKAVVGVPKTIDNDINYVWMSFGYATALEKAAEALRGAHVEAIGAPNGIGLVKVMGRDAGFIAAGAAVASQDANFVLVPEVDFRLEGERGLLALLERRIRDRGHALIAVAEGAGQRYLRDAPGGTDASGNPRKGDIGIYLRGRITAYFEQRGLPINLKYIDPSYLIRSVPANAWDRTLCDRMARNAVHAGMAGKTDFMVGHHNTRYIHVPIAAALESKRYMSRSGDLWRAVMSTTGQPRW